MLCCSSHLAAFALPWCSTAGSLAGTAAPFAALLQQPCARHRQCCDSRSRAPVPPFDALQRCTAVLGSQCGQGEVWGWRKRDTSGEVALEMAWGGWCRGSDPMSVGQHQHLPGHGAHPAAPQPRHTAGEAWRIQEKGRDRAVLPHNHGAVCLGCSFPLAWEMPSSGSWSCLSPLLVWVVLLQKQSSAQPAEPLAVSPHVLEEPWLHPLPGTHYG